MKLLDILKEIKINSPLPIENWIKTNYDEVLNKIYPPEWGEDIKNKFNINSIVTKEEEHNQYYPNTPIIKDFDYVILNGWGDDRIYVFNTIPNKDWVDKNFGVNTKVEEFKFKDKNIYVIYV
jgi:hypothetical protein